MASRQIGTVAQLWRYPVSSVGGERLEHAELSETGVGGDRRWCLVDTSSGEVAAPERRRRWRSSTLLLARNPDRLELQAGGRYEGFMLPGAALHPRWDAGTFAVEESTLAISTSNDAIMRCVARLDGDRLTLTDPEGCTFAYRREG